MRTGSIAVRLNTLPVILAVALALTLLLAACGGDPGTVGGGRGTPAAGATAPPLATATEAPTAELTPCRPERDREALTALYNATDGDGWFRNDNWLSDEPFAEWKGVFTEENGCVIGLALRSNRLSGEIPPELGDLTNLGELVDLSGNQLSGEIPAELGKLANLERLDLSGNQLSGEIPAELSNLSRLRQLYLSENQLSGEIPAELGNLSRLERLHLDGNQLSGCVPAVLEERLHKADSELGLLAYC